MSGSTVAFMDDRRVVVTGMGVISPVGPNVPAMWQNLVAGQSGIGPITLFDTSEFDVRIAGEAHGFDPTDYLSAKDFGGHNSTLLFRSAGSL